MNKIELQRSKKQILKTIKSHDNFAVLVSDPDADAIGSGLAMQEILEHLGKKAKLYSSFDMSDYSYLPRFLKHLKIDIAQLDFGQFDTVIMLDSSRYRRVLDTKYQFKNISPPRNKITINIDHHASNTHFADINYVPINITSTAEAIYDIFIKTIDLTQSLATNLLAAIIGDSGCFKYINTTPKVLKIAAKLIEKGADHQFIIKNLFYSVDKDIFKINQEAINRIKIERVGRFQYAYTIIYRTRIGTKIIQRNQRRVVQQAIQSIKDTDFSVIITSVRRNLTKLSFRSNASKLPVRKIAEHFGGGGHDVAAGAVTKLSPQETIEKLEKFLKQKGSQLKVL